MGTRPSKRQYAFDITLAVGFAALALLQLVIPADGYAMGPLWLEIALALTSSLPLAFRRIRPLLVAVAMFAPQIVASLFVAHLATFWGTLLPLAVAIYTCVRYSLAPLPAALAILALPAAFLVAYDVRTPAFGTWEDYAFAAVVFGAAWISGRVTRHLLQQRRALKEALRALEGQAAERRQQALLTERTRIAREMHDVVAHGISVMVVQAGSARLELGARRSWRSRTRVAGCSMS